MVAQELEGLSLGGAGCIGKIRCEACGYPEVRLKWPNDLLPAITESWRGITHSRSRGSDFECVAVNLVWVSTC